MSQSFGPAPVHPRGQCEWCDLYRAQGVALPGHCPELDVKLAEAAWERSQVGPEYAELVGAGVLGCGHRTDEIDPDRHTVEACLAEQGEGFPPALYEVQWTQADDPEANSHKVLSLEEVRADAPAVAALYATVPNSPDYLEAVWELSRVRIRKVDPEVPHASVP